MPGTVSTENSSVGGDGNHCRTSCRGSDTTPDG